MPVEAKTLGAYVMFVFFFPRIFKIKYIYIKGILSDMWEDDVALVAHTLCAHWLVRIIGHQCTGRTSAYMVLDFFFPHIFKIKYICIESRFGYMWHNQMRFAA